MVVLQIVVGPAWLAYSQMEALVLEWVQCLLRMRPPKADLRWTLLTKAISSVTYKPFVCSRQKGIGHCIQYCTAITFNHLYNGSKIMLWCNFCTWNQMLFKTPHSRYISTLLISNLLCYSIKTLCSNHNSKTRWFSQQHQHMVLKWDATVWMHYTAYLWVALNAR